MDVGAWQALPLEWPGRLSLTQAIDVYCVVAGGSPKAVSTAALVNIHIGSRIDEYRMSVYGELNAQSIRVAMSVAASLSGTGIDYKLVSLRRYAGHHMNSAALERKRSGHRALTT